MIKDLNIALSEGGNVSIGEYYFESDDFSPGIYRRNIVELYDLGNTRDKIE